MNNPKLMLYAGVAALCAVGYVYWRFTDDDASTGFFQDVGTGVGGAVGGAVIDLADGLVSGGALAIGDKVGIPRTNLTKCQQAIAEGRTWDASFDCPALDFLGYINPFN